jgi:hypothetical protein
MKMTLNRSTGPTRAAWSSQLSSNIIVLNIYANRHYNKRRPLKINRSMEVDVKLRSLVFTVIFLATLGLWVVVISTFAAGAKAA